MNNKQFENMSIQQLEDYIKEQEPIKEKLMQEAYDAPDVYRFQELSEKACEPIWRAGMHLRKIKPFLLKNHHENGELMTIKEFKESCNCGLFIDYDGSGNYSTETQESNISIYPSDISEGVYRSDFTHVKWYNR